MIIGAQTRPAQPQRRPETQPTLDIPGLPVDAVELPKIGDPDQAMQLKAPDLHRPVLLVHGLAQHADTWVNMKNFLVSNPHNHYGGTYTTAHESDFLFNLRDKPECNVFAIDISDNLAAPQEVAHEVSRALRAIGSFTGSDKVDVVTHSMGALVTREAINEGEGRIGTLVMIAPPNQGAYEANLATNAGWAHLYHHYPKEMMGAMDSLRLAEGPLGGKANEWLYDLNFAWPKDKQTVDGAIIITGTGMPTPDRCWTLAANGDGMVAARRAGLPDTPMFVATGSNVPAGHPEFRDFQNFRYNHLQIVSEPEVYQKVAEELANSPVAPPRPELNQEQLCFATLEPSFKAWTPELRDQPDEDWKQLSIF